MPNAEQVVYHRRFPSTLEAMAEVIGEALAALHRQGCVSEQQANTMRLCLEEALVNAIVHGNEQDASREVDLTILSGGDECTIKVCDEGQGFDPAEVPDPACEQLGGRGVCIIRHFMHRVAYNCAERCLTMAFSPKAFAKGASST